MAADLALDNHLVVRAAGDTLAICPPLIIEDKEIDQLFDPRKYLGSAEAFVERVLSLHKKKVQVQP